MDNVNNSDVSINPTQELANSIRILYKALDVVPDSHPYLFGVTILFDIIAVVPFGPSFFVEATGLPLMYQSTPNFFTILGQGDFFVYGEGSEIIADLYVNFGFYGVLIVMFFFGYFMSFLSVKAMINKKEIAVIVFLILSASAIYINRANFLMPLRDVSYALILNFILLRNIE